MSIDGVHQLVRFPPEFAERYRAAGIWSGLTLGEEFGAVAAAHPARVALVTPDAEFTYQQLDRQTTAIAAGLLRLGLEPGERVLCQIGNEASTVLAWYGMIKAGLVPVCTLVFHRAHELTQIARQAEPAAHIIQADFAGQDLTALATQIAAEQPSLRVLLTTGAGAGPEASIPLESLYEPQDDDQAVVAAAQAQITPEDIAVLQLSGGTTNIPKLIPRLHAEYWYNARVYAEAIGLTADGCIPFVTPLVHNAGIVCGLHAAHSQGATFALCGLEPGGWAAISDKAPPTHFLMAPPHAHLISQDPELREKLRSLLVIIWVLSKLPPEILREYENDACVMGQLFGMGEGLCMVTPLDAPPEIRHRAVGTPLSPLDEVRVLEPGTERPVPRGEQGELCCRGPYTLRGYFNAAEHNAEAFTTDGFYRTGDIVVQLEDFSGAPIYALEDRIKDMISRGGEKINAAEMDELLRSHPAIEESAVVAMPHPVMGEKACAFIVLAEGATAPDLPELQSFLDGRSVAKYKWPERIEVRDELPKTNIYKINKLALRREIAGLIADEIGATA